MNWKQIIYGLVMIIFLLGDDLVNKYINLALEGIMAFAIYVLLLSVLVSLGQKYFNIK